MGFFVLRAEILRFTQNDISENSCPEGTAENSPVPG